MYTDHQTTRISSKTTGVPDDARLHHNPILMRLTLKMLIESQERDLNSRVIGLQPTASPLSYLGNI